MFNITTMPVLSNIYSDLNTTASIPIGTNIFITNTTSYLIYVFIGNSVPAITSEYYPLNYNESVEIPSGADKVWVRSDKINTTLLIQYASLAIKPYPTVIPSGAFEGIRALTIQGYTEANVKNGIQFNASRRVVGLAAGANADSIFLTGNKPVILKARKIGYTGNGVAASIYRQAVYTGGTVAEINNPNDLNPATTTVTLLSAPTITSIGILTTAIAYSEGNTSNQGKGIPEAVLGEEVVMSPNTAYLLRITSLDTAAQNFSSYLSWYEGSPDLPRP